MNRTLNEQTVFSRSEHVTHEVVDNEAILISLVTGTYFSLNKVGTQFWERLDGQQTIADHAAAMAAQYGVDVDMVTADLLDLAHKMDQDDLLVIH